jgi:hypothetical protein
LTCQSQRAINVKKSIILAPTKYCQKFYSQTSRITRRLTLYCPCIGVVAAVAAGLLQQFSDDDEHDDRALLGHRYTSSTLRAEVYRGFFPSSSHTDVTSLSTLKRAVFNHAAACVISTMTLLPERTPLNRSGLLPIDELGDLPAYQ